MKNHHITQDWIKWFPTYNQKAEHGSGNLTLDSQLAAKLLENRNGTSSGCEVWDKLSGNIVEAIAKGSTMKAQADNIKKCIAHVTTCHAESCKRANRLLKEMNLDSEDMDLK